MSKWQKINLLLFSALVIVTTSLVYILPPMLSSSPFGKPWHLSPSVHEDSLSQNYLNDYKVLNLKSLHRQILDSSRTNVFILIDAWGVPIQESVLKEDFSYFENLPHVFALHQRLANRDKHAERVEFRDAPENKIYLFGGDSLEYHRDQYMRELGYNHFLYCNKCSDSIMLSKIDSLLANDSLKFIAWTTQSSRTGDKDSLRTSLKQIASFVQRHPDVQVVVQGTHRPTLGTSQIRNAHKSHWVPAVILNKK